MISIIPNWHPIFVHFTVALFTLSSSLYLLCYFNKFIYILPIKLSKEFQTTARWCLLFAAAITIITVIAGFIAFNSVDHDEISHQAMKIHRNWALVTLIFILFSATLSLINHSRDRSLSIYFVTIAAITQLLVLTTAWHGAELVFRYGLGVKALPQMLGEHQHSSKQHGQSEHSH